jgi:hypothetical protein
VGKSFEDYAAEYAKKPFPLPMPGGDSIPVPNFSIDTQHLMTAAARDDGSPFAGTPFAGMEVLIGQDAAAKVAAAWNEVPLEAWLDMLADMRKYFGTKNSAASPPS